MAAWLEIRTIEGLRGFAYAHRGLIIRDLIDRRLRQELVGKDALARELLWHRLWELDRVEEFPIYTIGIVDVALWDLAGKAAGLPLYRLLGSARESIPAYASTTTFSTISEYLEVADQCLELGFRAIKLHAFGDAREDARLARALRRHVGDDVALMYDGSAGFDLLEAVWLGHALADEDFLYYEEPMREFSVHAYARLAERVTVPLLVAETSDGAHMNTADFIVAGCASAVRTSASHRGGITGAMRIAHLADAFLLRAEVHGSGLVHRHLVMAIHNNTYFESFISTNPAAGESVVDREGQVSAPTGVGVGWEDAGNPDVPAGFPA
ncbi:enolase C-terminal domain-like protein [Microbacterium sp. SLBN-154]|uniref:enolase C-terminal domain-like protein n=1 Tax=Microbacterium sp. SLBN-154 TaxID=2768458 RepID=UPI00190F5A9D|nr:enolase C-terminal domain-like protein [Microbacterium sp. SLBN-154]